MFFCCPQCLKSLDYMWHSIVTVTEQNASVFGEYTFLGSRISALFLFSLNILEWCRIVENLTQHQRGGG